MPAARPNTKNGAHGVTRPTFRLAGISLRQASAVTKVMADKTARQALTPTNQITC